jgi:hypothetical protein
MKRLMMVLTVVACSGGEASAPKPPKLIPASLSVVSGDQQQDTVMATLAQPVAVVVTTSAPSGAISLSLSVAGSPQATTGTPVPNQIINFRVTDPDCGQPFAGTAITDAQGQAKERWELGNRAKLCHMEARAVDQATGAPLVFDTASATATAGKARVMHWGGPYTAGLPTLSMAPGDSLDLHTVISALADSYGNAVAVGPTVPGWYVMTQDANHNCTSGCNETLSWMLHVPATSGTYHFLVTVDEAGLGGTLTVTP